MSKSKLISVRIDEDTLRLIDNFVDRSKWYRRYSFINNLLTSILRNASAKDVETLYHWYRFSDKQLLITIEERKRVISGDSCSM